MNGAGDAFLASLFSVSVAGLGIAAGVLGLVLGSWLGWSARDREARAQCRAERADGWEAGRAVGHAKGLREGEERGFVRGYDQAITDSEHIRTKDLLLAPAYLKVRRLKLLHGGVATG